MGDRHKDQDREVKLDGIGGVNILVKAEVHRSGKYLQTIDMLKTALYLMRTHRDQLPMLCFRKSS